jgi:hypothetical protein
MTYEHDQAMWAKGYRYKLVDTDGKIEPLYAKTLADIGTFCRDWQYTTFDITPIFNEHYVSDLLKLWKSKEDGGLDRNRARVIKIFAEDHPGLVATFLAQGFADEVLTQSDLNSVANLLIQYRSEFFAG